MNPIAPTPPLVPSAHRSVYEHYDSSALRAAVLVDVLSIADSLGGHVYGSNVRRRSHEAEFSFQPTRAGLVPSTSS